MVIKILITIIVGILFFSLFFRLIRDKMTLLFFFILGTFGGNELKILYQVFVFISGILFYYYLTIKNRNALGATFAILVITFLSMLYGNLIYSIFHLSFFRTAFCSPAINWFIR